ncbi:hypothetical protein DFJ73DRAFT_464901 [Zopfochytrium polystomum]|nr:hypothetical protein DFJ73DRAFT_464901 [Zopfochytrium polystomum]
MQPFSTFRTPEWSAIGASAGKAVDRVFAKDRDEGAVTTVTSGFQFNGTASQINCICRSAPPRGSCLPKLRTRVATQRAAVPGRQRDVQSIAYRNTETRCRVAMMGLLRWGIASRQTFVTTRTEAVGPPGNSPVWGDAAVPSSIVAGSTATSFNFTLVLLPPSDYKLRIKGLKHFLPFSRLDDDESFDVSASKLFCCFSLLKLSLWLQTVEIPAVEIVFW